MGVQHEQGVELVWGAGIECWTEIKKQYVDIGIILKMCEDWVEGSGDGILCGSLGFECEACIYHSRDSCLENPKNLEIP